MAINPSKTPPIPPLPDWATGAAKDAPTPTVPKAVTVPSTVPNPGAPGLPDWATGAKTQPINDGSSLPTVPVPNRIAQAELRGAQRDLAQATRDAQRQNVPEQTVENIVEQKEPNVGLKILGAVLNTPTIKYGILKPLEILDVGRRGIVGALSKDVGIIEAIKDPALSSRDAFNIDLGEGPGRGTAEAILGFAVDVLLDPVTYATFGTGGFVKSVAGGLAKEGAIATSKGTTRAIIKAAGQKAVKEADEAARFAGQFLDDAARKATREAAEKAARETEALIVKAAPKAGTPGAAAVQAAKDAQVFGPRRVIGAKSREELAQGAREVRDIAAQSGNKFVVETLTDDVIGDLATRGYSAVRGEVAQALGMRGGIRWGIGKARVILPGTERIADTFGQALTGIRVGAKSVPILDVPFLKQSLALVNKGFVGTKIGNTILRNTTPIGEGGLFGSVDILRMRTALRSGTLDGRKLPGAVANDFVRLLAQDGAYRGLKAAAKTDAQQLLRGIYGTKGFQKYSNTVLDLVDNPVIGERLATMTAADATAAVGRTVDDAELAIAKSLREVGDEFYQRANYLHQRQQLMAGRRPDLIEDLPKNKAWFPHALSDDARKALNNKRLPEEALDALGVDRSFALAGSNLRQLIVGAEWFGRKLTQKDINGGVKRLNEIARPSLGFDFFETNAESAFNKYAQGWARDTSYTNFLYNMSLATEARRGLTDTPLGKTVEDVGAGQFAGKAFEGDITQEASSLIKEVPPPKKLQAFNDAITDVLNTDRMRALDNIPTAKAELIKIRDEIATLKTSIENKGVKGELVFSDYTNQILNDIEQRILDLERLVPTGSLTPGYGASITSEANALLQSLKDEAAGLTLAIDSIDPKKLANTVPIFLDAATRFLQVNAINYPGLVGSPQFTELIQNVRRLEDPAVAKALQNTLGPLTQMFKTWVTATPGFHNRNAMSNAFFGLSAGADLRNIGQAAKIYTAYNKFLKKQGLFTKVDAEGSIIREGALSPGVAKYTDPKTFDAVAEGIPFEPGNFLPEIYAGKTITDFLLSPEAKKFGFVGDEPVTEAARSAADILTAMPMSGFGEVSGDVFAQTGRMGVSGATQTGTGALPSLSRGLAKPLVASRTVGNYVETFSRFALLYDGIKQGLSPEQAAARVQKYLIDYSDLSRADQVIKQIIPFWMWASRSFPLILESSYANPRAYAVWNNFTRNLRDEEAQGNMVRPSYLLPSIPVGGNVLFNPDFGFQRAGEGIANLTDPRSIAGGLTPAIRIPLELGFEQDFRTGDQLIDPRYNDPIKESIKYIGKGLVPQVGAIGRATNAGIGALQAFAQGAGALGQEDIQALLEQIAQAPQTKLPETVRSVAGIGKPAYIQDEQGTMTAEESRQRLLSFFGIPVTQLQPFQQTTAIKKLIERLEEETTRAKLKAEEQRKKKNK